jgi:hypothetical protein
MEISRDDLDRAVAQGTITKKQADELWGLLKGTVAATQTSAEGARQLRSGGAKSRFDFVHLAYYFGALIVIGAMGWFMTLGWETFGGGGIFAIACVYAFCFVLAGRTLWQKDDLKTPGGLLITMAVGMTPIGIYGLERLLGWWPESDPGVYQGFHTWIKGGWFAMEIATIAAGALALRFFRFPFLTATTAFTLWYMSMDLAPLLYGPHPSFNDRAWLSADFGLAVLLVGYLIDRRTQEDFAFWLYLFGLLAFWGGLSSMQSDSELRKVIYLLINLGLMFVSIILNRRVFIVFGSLGVMGYLGHLAYKVFKDSMMFPFALSLIGIAIIALGVHYHGHRARYERLFVGLVPESMRKLLPPERMRG